MSQLPIGTVLREAADDARLAEVWQRIERGGRPRRWVRWTVATGSLVAACLALWLVRCQWQRRAPLELADHRPFGAMEATAGTGELRLAVSDGSEVLLAPGTRLEPVENRSGTFRVALRAGHAEFDVRPGGGRHWIIDGGAATVEVVGTHFVVERSAAGVRVSVSRGRVLVRSPRLVAGEQLLRAGDAVVIAAETAPPVGPSPTVSANAAPVDLLAAADRARQAHRTDEALRLLERAAGDRGDPRRAAVAAFTLGRLILDSGGDSARAAVAFQRALALGLPDALVDDGYRRAIEAFDHAGDHARARALESEYCIRFPGRAALASSCPPRHR